MTNKSASIVAPHLYRQFLARSARQGSFAAAPYPLEDLPAARGLLDLPGFLLNAGKIALKNGLLLAAIFSRHTAVLTAP
jgi:hypothetical protein